MSRHAYVLRFGLLGALSGLPAAAWACPASCNRLRLLGSNGVSVPGDQVYFKVLADDPGAPSLKTEDGKDIPASVRMIGPDRVFAPIDPIPADTGVVLRYTNNTCGGGTLPITYRFQTRAALEIRLLPGQFNIAEYGLLAELPELASNSQPTAPVAPIAFQRLGLRPLDENNATGHLTDFDLTVDGRPVSYAAWPLGTPIELHAVCSTSGDVPQPLGTCHETIYTPGRHVVAAQPHIVGYPDPPPVTLDLDFERACAINRNAPPRLAAQPTGGASGAGAREVGAPASATPSSQLDASTPPASGASSAGIPAPAPMGGARGCSAAAGKTRGTPGWLALLACLGPVLFARRSNPRARAPRPE